MRRGARAPLRRVRSRGCRPSPTEPAGITIGDLEGPTAVVDGKGRIIALDGSWRIEWGAGADDRWHVAHSEVAVRQRRIDDAPVLETAMRVAGGDLIQRVASVTDGRSRALIVELENDSPAALVAAVVVRAQGPVKAGIDGLSAAGIEVAGDRPAGGVTAAASDPWPQVLTGPPSAPVSVEAGTDGGGALVVAVPHRQSVAFTVALRGEPPTDPGTPARVATGWRAVTAGAATISVPDHSLTEAWRRVVPDLVIAAGSDRWELAAQAAWFLDVAGLHDEADRARGVLVAEAERGGLRGVNASGALLALASRDLRAAESSGLDALAGPLAEMAGDALTSDVLEVVAAALHTDAPAAAEDARRLAASRGRGWWEPAAPVVQGVGAVIGAVVDDDPFSTLRLLPSVPSTWFGTEIDVRGVRTLTGTISFSVRWHGSRPALLWERTGGPASVTITVPGLDADWTTDERAGETLLGEPDAGASAESAELD